MTVFFFFLLVLETVILGRVMKNLAAGRGRKEEDSGNRLGTLLLRRPWTWGENVEPSERSVKMLSVWRAVSFALVSILTQTRPPRQTHSDSDYLSLLALVRGQIPNSFVLVSLHSYSRFSSYLPTQGVQIPPTMMTGGWAPGTKEVWLWRWHRPAGTALGDSSAHDPPTLLPGLLDGRISRIVGLTTFLLGKPNLIFSLFCYHFYGSHAEKLRNNVYLHFTAVTSFTHKSCIRMFSFFFHNSGHRLYS